MSYSKAVEVKNKSAKIYLKLATVFIAIFSTITVLYLFVSALNF
jgi:hypothetical protein